MVSQTRPDHTPSAELQTMIKMPRCSSAQNQLGRYALGAWVRNTRGGVLR